MTKILHGKLLSIILVIAICCAALCGSIIATNAAAADYKGSYTINVGDDKNAVPFGSSVVTATVEFNLAAGFGGGEFTITADGDKYTIGENVRVITGTTKDGGDFNANDVEVNTFVNGNGRDVLFWINNGVTICTSITFEYTINLASYVSAGYMVKYAVGINVEEDAFAIETEYSPVPVTFEAKNSDEYFHAHYAWSDVDALKDMDGNSLSYKTGEATHTIATGLCHVCQSVNNEDSYKRNLQVFPDYTKFDGAQDIYNSSVGWMGVSGVSVAYNDDGSLGVYVHGYAQHYTGSVFLLITDKDGKEVMRTKNSDFVRSTIAQPNGTLNTNAVMFEFNNLSAKDIDQELLFTMVAVYNESNVPMIHHSRTVTFSLADYCEKVVSGEAVWPEGTLDSEIEADKDVAAALYYYGASIDESVFDKHTGGSEEESEQIIVPEEKITVEWQDTTNWAGSPSLYANWDEFVKSMSGDGSEESPYIITTAEQLYFLGAGYVTAANTTDVHFKVADNIGAFNFKNNADTTINTTASELLNGNTTWNKFWHANSEFAGTFDGNGAIVYNYFSTGNNPGLFHKLAKNAHIKNITVASSVFISGNSQYAQGAGAIFGNVAGTWNGDSITIENCRVVNCYIAANEYTGGYSFGAGAIGGYAHALNVHISNCFVADNIIGVPSNGSTGGLIATGYSTGSTITNTVVLGTTPYNKWAANINLQGCAYQSFANATYTNVYTDQPKTDCFTDQANTTTRTFDDSQIKVISPSYAKGENAVTNLGLSPSLYVATNDFPALKSNFKWTAVSDGDETHTYKAAVSLDGVVTNYTANTEAHNMVESDDGKTRICSACGYSKEIVGKIEYINANYDDWNGTEASEFSDKEHTGLSPEDAIVIANAEELAFLIGGAERSGATFGKYYTVAPNTVFNMNGLNGIGFYSTLADVKAATVNSNRNWCNYWDNDRTHTFGGIFDGNGLIVYNVYGKQWAAGLFPTITQTRVNGLATEVKNVTVKNSWFESTGGAHTSGAAAIVGSIRNEGSGHPYKISGCVVENCNIVGNAKDGDTTKSAALIISDISWESITIDNCLTVNNSLTCPSTSTLKGGLVAYTNQPVTITNTVCIGNDPVATGIVSGSVSYSNVYTDQASSTGGVATKATDDMSVDLLGLNDSMWFDSTVYPQLKAFHKFANEYIDETTHKPICVIRVDGVACTVCGVAQEHTLTENAAGTANECSCGYREEVISKINRIDANYHVWTGNIASGFARGTGTEDDPYIIETPAQLAFAVRGAGSTSNSETNNTDGKYFEVVANSVFNMNGLNGITLDSTAGQVIAASTTGTTWNNMFQNSDKMCFKGNFNGNGLIVYNLYGSSHAMGLFPCIDGTSTFKNVTVKNSRFIESGSTNMAVGAIAGWPNSNSANITIENCNVENCDIQGTATVYGAGAILGSAKYGHATLNNCLSINNSINVLSSALVSGADVGGFASTSGWGLTVKNSISIGASAKSTNAETMGAYTNVYTDLTGTEFIGESALNNMTFDDISAWMVTDGYPTLSSFHNMTDFYVDEGKHKSVCQIFIDGVQCSVCGPVTNHTMIDSDDGKMSECVCGYGYEIKGIHAMNLPEVIKNRILANNIYNTKFKNNAAFTAAYGADEIIANGIDKEFCLYTTSLNLKTNPHIAFTFAFNNIEKEMRQFIYAEFTPLDNDGTPLIEERYSSTVGDNTGYDSSALSPNWVNNAGAGRYHLYRFKDLPVTLLCKKIKVYAEYQLDFTGEMKIEGTYSAAGYAINAMKLGEEYAQQVNAAKALVYYSEMLNARFWTKA